MSKPDPAKAASAEERESRALAERYHVPYIDLTAASLDRELIQGFPPDFLYRANFVPLTADKTTVRIAIADPSGTLVCMTVYLRGAFEVIRRLGGVAVYTKPATDRRR